MTSTEVLRVVRLGRAFTMVNGRRLAVHAAHALDGQPVASGVVDCVDGVVIMGTLDGAVELERVQPEGSSAMDARSWWSGARLAEGPRWT